MIELNKNYFEDNWDTMKGMDDGCVDLLLQDTPFGVTQNDWDIKPDLKIMWTEWLRITKIDGAMIFFATQPFASELIISNINHFKYDLIWEKSRATGFLNANRMPLRSHEYILIFYRKLPTYNPQMRIGKPNHVRHGEIRKSKTNNNYGAVSPYPQTSTTEKHPSSIIYLEQQDPNKLLHPTQKPIDLIRYLILTYSNKNDLVYDGYAGSGTTAEACIMENRNFITSENKLSFFEMTEKRTNNAMKKQTLFDYNS